MRHLVIGIGELVHLDNGTEGTIVGENMKNRENLISKGDAILIEDNIISKIIPEEELIDEFFPEFKKFKFEKDGEIKIIENSDKNYITHAGGNSIIPGLIDSHTHLIWSGDRSNELSMRMKGMTYQEISNSGGGIRYTVKKTRNSSVNELINLGKSRMKEALRNGTTAMEAKSGYGLSIESELLLTSVMNDLSIQKDLPSIDITWMGAHDIPENFKKDEYIEQVINYQLPEIVEQGYARSCDVFCEPGWFNIEETELIIDAAKKQGLSTRLHIDEFSDGGGAELAAEKSVETGDHALHSSIEGRELMSKSNVIQGFLPTAPFTMGMKEWPPIEYCIENEMPWTIATDFNPNCRVLSLPSVASICVQRLGIDPLAVLCATTRNASESVIHKTEIKHGMIKEGYIANMNIVNGDKWEGWCLQLGTSPFKATILEGNTEKHH